MTDPTHPPTLKTFLRARLEELKWTQTKLAEISGVSAGSISNLLTGKAVPETRTVERIADALGVSRQTLFAFLAREARDDVAGPEIDPGALHAARRLTALPPAVRAPAIEAVSAVVDGFAALADRFDAPARIVGEHGVLSPMEELERGLRILKHRDPALYAELMAETEARWRASSALGSEGI